MASVLVLTGDSTREEADAAPPEQRPDHIIDTFDQLVPDAVWRRPRGAGT